MATCLSEHNRVMREAIAATDGREVDTAGDSFFAVFSRASNAVDCARRAQVSLAEADWPAGEVPRVGSASTPVLRRLTTARSSGSMSTGPRG